MNQFVLCIKMNGSAPIECLAMNEAEKALGLSEQGITWHENADLMIERDANNEVVIIGNSNCTAELNRNGRKLRLANKHIRLLARDIITLGSTVFEIDSVYKCAPASNKFDFKRLTKTAMKTMAAALIASAFVACSNKHISTSEPGAVVESTVEENYTSGEASPEDILPETTNANAVDVKEPGSCAQQAAEQPANFVEPPTPELPQDVDYGRLEGEPPEPAPVEVAPVQDEPTPVVPLEPRRGEAPRVIPADQANQNKENADQAAPEKEDPKVVFPTRKGGKKKVPLPTDIKPPSRDKSK